MNEVVNAELVAALIKARSEFPDIPKTKTGQTGNIKFKYADLGDVIAAVMPKLHVNGLTITQTLGPLNGQILLRTCLLHKSGHSIDSFFPIPWDEKISEKGFGGWLTYMKRYALCAILFVHPEDDIDCQTSDRSAPRSADIPKPRMNASRQGPSKQAEDAADFGNFGGGPL